MRVFAFDRDWTVDVNPHPRFDAVPLGLVRYLAHSTQHKVYAIGNQDLTEEAAIPGVVDIVGRHPDADWYDELGEIDSDGYYENFPTRRDRLRMISDIHPEADSYTVIDDIDLSDMESEGWNHYQSWQFMNIIESENYPIDWN